MSTAAAPLIAGAILCLAIAVTVLAAVIATGFRNLCRELEAQAANIGSDVESAIDSLQGDLCTAITNAVSEINDTTCELADHAGISA